jgi:hypothetical protein
MLLHRFEECFCHKQLHVVLKMVGSFPLHIIYYRRIEANGKFFEPIFWKMILPNVTFRDWHKRGKRSPNE